MSMAVSKQNQNKNIPYAECYFLDILMVSFMRPILMDGELNILMLSVIFMLSVILLCVILMLSAILMLSVILMLSAILMLSVILMLSAILMLSVILISFLRWMSFLCHSNAGCHFVQCHVLSTIVFNVTAVHVLL